MIDRKIICASMFLVLAALMAAPATAQQKPLSGGTLRVAYNTDPLSVNTILKFWSPTAYIVSMTLDTLILFDKNFQIVGDLAKSWTFGADGKSVTFQLRNDVWWSDGVKFTSADVKWHYLMMLNGTSVTRPRARDIIRIDTPDDYTVTFTYSSVRNQLLLLLPFGIWSTTVDERILPMHTYRWGTTRNFTDNPANSGVGMPTTGPFMITEYKQGQSMTFLRNPLYGVKSFPDRHPAYLDKVIFQFILDSNSEIAALQGGQVDMIHEGLGISVPPQDLARVSKLPGITVSGSPYYTTWRMTFNFGNASKQYPWVKDIRVRQAFSYAINKDSIVKTLLQGITIPEYGPISSLIKDWYNPAITKYQYDPAKAQQLLDDAGYKADASGVRIKAPMVSYATGTLLGEAIKSDLQKVGIVLDVQPVEDTTFFSKYETSSTGLNPYPLGLQTFGAGPFPFTVDGQLAAKFWSPNGQNCGFYNNTQVNQLIDQAQNTNDLSKMKDIYNQYQTVASQDLPAIYLWDHWKINAWNKDFNGIVETMTPEPGWFAHGLAEIWWTKASGQTSTQAATVAQPTGGIDMTTMGAVVAVLIIIAAAALLMRRRKTSSK